MSINDTEFWEKSYLWRSLTHQKVDAELSGTTHKHQACPLFIKDIAKEIISAGKSLQLIRHVPMTSNMTSHSGVRCKDLGGLRSSSGVNESNKLHRGYSTAGLTLVEVFFVSVAGLIGHGDHVYNYFLKDDFPSIIPCLLRCEVDIDKLGGENSEISEKTWVIFLDSILQEREASDQAQTLLSHGEKYVDTSLMHEHQLLKSFCPKNPVITVCQKLLNDSIGALRTLTLSKDSHLPPLNDEDLREAIFSSDGVRASSTKKTNFTFGFQFSESQYLRSIEETQLLEAMFPFPTVLPAYEVQFN